jgi:prepilin-type N-terminal cleavage/methylation domain-containing protein
MKKNKQGFTLLELLVVVSIIGILIAIGAVAYSTAQKKGRDARRKGDLKAIQNAMEECYSLATEYPITLTPGSALTCTDASSTEVMSSFPSDPKSGEYIQVTTASDSYEICADLENDGTWDGSNQDHCVSNLQ